MSTQTFQDILASRTGEQSSTFNISEDWTQGRTVCGAIIGALAHESMQRTIHESRVLRGLQICYASPCAPGNVLFENEIIREGKSVTTVLSCISPGGGTSALVTGIYGAGRKSVLSVDAVVGKPDKEVDTLQDFYVPEGIGPNHMRHFQVRYSSGGTPFSGSQEREFSAFVRFVPGETADFRLSHLIAFADSLPTPALSMLTELCPASTLTWNIEIIDASTDFSPEQWWWMTATVDAAANGYSYYVLTLVNPSNRVAAISRQIGAIFG